jgi:hypothetical protein
MKKFLAGIAALAAVALAVPGAATAQQSAATIMLLHGIPGVTVDVVVAGEVVIPGFEPGDMQDLSSFAGQTLTELEVRIAGTEDVAIGPVASFDVPASGNWTVVAHLDAAGTPTLSPFENDTASVDAGSGRLTVVHLAAAPAVDVVLGEARPVENISNGEVQSLGLAAGEVAGAEIAPTGGDPIAPVPTVEIVDGENLIVYAVGSLEDETFTFYTQTVELASAESSAVTADGTSAPTAVNTGGPVEGSASTLPLLAAATALFAVAGAAFVIRRRSVEA